jgi:hypothetical protein
VTAELLGKILTFVLAAGSIIAGWIRTNQHGAETEKRKESEQDVKDLEARLQRRTDSVSTDAGHADRLRRAAERLARLRDRAAK